MFDLSRLLNFIFSTDDLEDMDTHEDSNDSGMLVALENII